MAAMSRKMANRHWFTAAAVGLAAGLAACGAPPSPVSVGEPAESLFGAFIPYPPHAATCDGEAHPLDSAGYEACLGQPSYVVSFRRERHLYTYTVEDDVVTQVEITDFNASDS